VLKRLADGETLKSLAKSYGVTHPTIVRALRKFEGADLDAVMAVPVPPIL
jgi:hypothetical protein